MKSKLKPCPFCGGKAAYQIVDEGEVGPNAGGHFIECEKCSASTALMFPAMESVHDLLVERWSARADARNFDDAMLGIMGEVDGLCDLLADSGELRVRETPAVERLNEIVELLGKLLPTATRNATEQIGRLAIDAAKTREDDRDEH